MNKYTEAKHSEGKILSFHPTGDYYFAKGIDAYDHDDLNNAEKYLRRAVQLEPQEPMILFQLAIIYTELGKYEQSNELLQEIKELDDKFCESYYLLANNYAYIGLLEEAYYYGNYYLENCHEGQFKEDIEELLELLAIELEIAFDDEDRLIMWQDRAKKLLASSKYAEAIELLQELIEQYPQYWPAYNNLALAYFYNGEIEKSEATIEKVLQQNEGNLHALCNKLVLSYYEGNLGDVSELAKMLAKVKPMLTEHRFKLGSTFAIIGHYEQAYELLRPLKITDAFLNDDSFYYWLSYSAYYTGREKLARLMWEKVIVLNPEKVGTEPWNNDEFKQ